MGKIIDLVERNYVDTIYEVIDAIVSKDREVQSLLDKAFEATKSSFLPDRSLAHQKLLQRKTLVLQNWLLEQTQKEQKNGRTNHNG
jgi:hypothetical protein